MSIWSEMFICPWRSRTFAKASRYARHARHYASSYARLHATRYAIIPSNDPWDDGRIPTWSYGLASWYGSIHVQSPDDGNDGTGNARFHGRSKSKSNVWIIIIVPIVIITNDGWSTIWYWSNECWVNTTCKSLNSIARSLKRRKLREYDCWYLHLRFE